MNGLTPMILSHLPQQRIAALAAHRDRLSATGLKAVHAACPTQFDDLSLEIDGLIYDYSRNLLDQDVICELVGLAQDAGVAERRDAMFAGEPVNSTENRAALHTALRLPPGSSLIVDGNDISADVQGVLVRMAGFADAVHDGEYQVSGGRVATVVGIGIGGSDLGPQMAAEALKPFAKGPDLRFIANVDGADILDVLKGIDLSRTLFIVTSKTFTTQETMANATSARVLVAEAVGDKRAGRHFAAVSTNLEATRAFGIDDERTFGFWDWVGGRYSIWSAVGLSLMIGIGSKQFRQFLAGGYEIDQHFQSAPLAANIPVLMGLIGIWHRNFLRYPAQAIVPYEQRLARFPAFLQQLEMESNGKNVRRNGELAEDASASLIWGEPGTNSQHAFFQWLHQGTDVVPVDFLVGASSASDTGDHHAMLLANCLAQAQALMSGRSTDNAKAQLLRAGFNESEAGRLAPHKRFAGNRPSSTILYDCLTPSTLGKLVALYEHKTLVQSVIWDINPFDQWGVELGKEMASSLLPVIRGDGKKLGQDATTDGLIAAVSRMRG